MILDLVAAIVGLLVIIRSMATAADADAQADARERARAHAAEMLAVDAERQP